MSITVGLGILVMLLQWYLFFDAIGPFYRIVRNRHLADDFIRVGIGLDAAVGFHSRFWYTWSHGMATNNVYFTAFKCGTLIFLIVVIRLKTKGHLR